LLAVAGTSALLAGTASAQQALMLTQPASIKSAVAAATIVHRKAMGTTTNRNGGEAASPAQISAAQGRSPASFAGSDSEGYFRGPGDLYGFGGPTIATAQHHAIYIGAGGSTCNTPACLSTWGNPAGFLADLNNSRYIHVTDQYVGTSAGGRYPVGTWFYTTPFTAPQYFYDSDMVTLAAEAASITNGAGYNHIYHIFLPPGQDECFGPGSVCYSPDNPFTWGFCAYHGSADVPGVGHVIYTVEPYQNIPGCSVRPGTPNGMLADSTNNVLSHEVVETITDPDGSGWWNVQDNGMFGEEIGDECAFIVSAGFDPATWRSYNGHVYATQPQYNNNKHGCTTGP